MIVCSSKFLQKTCQDACGDYNLVKLKFVTKDFKVHRRFIDLRSINGDKARCWVVVMISKLPRLLADARQRLPRRS